MRRRSVADALALARRLFARRNRDAPSLSAQLLLAEVLGLRREELVLERSRSLSREQWRNFWRLAARRSLGEPVAYILGRKEFYGREFALNPAGLTPRPETEHLVEAVLHHRPAAIQGGVLRFADLGTGSGILAVTLALELPESTGLALDICPRAVLLARENARRHDVQQRLVFCRADLASPPLLYGSLDILVSNPPYVSAAEYASLSPEVVHYEPRQALVPMQGGGVDGLESIALVIHAAASALRQGGLLALEMGCSQGREVRVLAEAGPFSRVQVLQDLAGLDRVLVAFRQ